MMMITKGVERFNTSNTKVLHWISSVGSIHLLSSKPIFLISIIMLFLHFLPFFQTKFFQQISSPKFCTHSSNKYINKTIRALEDGGTRLHSHRHDSLKSHIINYSYNVQWLQLVQLPGGPWALRFNYAVCSEGKRTALVTWVRPQPSCLATGEQYNGTHQDFECARRTCRHNRCLYRSYRKGINTLCR